MKTVLQAFICSIIIHLIYLTSTLIIGYIKTKNYTPDISSAYENVEMLQNEVAFGQGVSPFFIGISFIGFTLLCYLILYWVKGRA